MSFITINKITAKYVKYQHNLKHFPTICFHASDGLFQILYNSHHKNLYKFATFKNVHEIVLKTCVIFFIHVQSVFVCEQILHVVKMSFMHVGGWVFLHREMCLIIKCCVMMVS